MKKVTNTTLRTLAVMALAGLATVSTAYAGGEGKKKEAKVYTFPEDSAMEMTESWEGQLAADLNMDLNYYYSLPETDVKVYDAEDNLVAEGSLNGVGLPTSDGLKDVLRNASLMITYQGVHYYRLD